MASLERAIALAVMAHEGQVDKVGQPYILHPLRLMLKLYVDEERMAAVLHDTVEDTNVTLAQLTVEGFSSNVVNAVDHLTHREDQTYEAYIQRVRYNPIAKKIKLLDLEDNMDIRRLDHQPSDRDWKRIKKYRLAWAVLKDLPTT